ncbi:MAG: hypothetical protein HY364_04335 [Candidatus Aenigmarchaeota archaeon]|nr:hypothetical protein [Candidatus Aenigmarchaeota archaeon]
MDGHYASKTQSFLRYAFMPLAAAIIACTPSPRVLDAIDPTNLQRYCQSVFTYAPLKIGEKFRLKDVSEGRPVDIFEVSPRESEAETNRLSVENKFFNDVSRVPPFNYVATDDAGNVRRYYMANPTFPNGMTTVIFIPEPCLGIFQPPGQLPERETRHNTQDPFHYLKEL